MQHGTLWYLPLVCVSVYASIGETRDGQKWRVKGMYEDVTMSAIRLALGIHERTLRGIIARYLANPENGHRPETNHCNYSYDEHKMATAESGEKCVSTFSCLMDVCSESEWLKLLNSCIECLIRRRGLFANAMLIATLWYVHRNFAV